MSSQVVNLAQKLESKIDKTARNRRRRAKRKAKRKGKNAMRNISNEVKLGEEIAKSNRMLGPSPARAKTTRSIVNKSKRPVISQGIITEAMVMGMILAPRQNMTCRFSDKFTSEETAVARPWQVYDAPWDQNTGNQDLPFYIFRDPLRAAIQKDYNVAGTSSTYLASISDLDDNISQDPTYTFNPSDVNNYVPVNIVQLEALVDYQPHGPVLYPGRDNVGNSQARFLWIDSTCSLQFSFITPLLTGQQASIRFPHWDGGKIDYPDAPLGVLPASNVLTFTPATSGYYGIEVAPINFNSNSTLITKFEVEWKNNSGPCFAQLTLPNLSELITSMEGITVLAGTMMYTQTSSDLNNGGEIVGVQIRKEDMWYDNITFAGVKARSNSTVKNAKKGIYGFIRPSSDKDFQASQSYVIESSTLVQSGYPLQPLNDFLCVIPHVAVNTNRSGEITLAYAIEFKTSNTMIETSNIRALPEVFDSAVQKTAKMLQWHENPKHLEDIANFIKNVAGKVVEYGPRAMELAKLVGTFF